MQRYVAGLPVERAAVDHLGIGHPPATGAETTSAAPTEEQPA